MEGSLLPLHRQCLAGVRDFVVEDAVDAITTSTIVEKVTGIFLGTSRGIEADYLTVAWTKSELPLDRP